MAFVAFSGQGPLLPDVPRTQFALAFNSSLVIDATGEKLAMMGRIWLPARTGTKDIRRVQFRFGPVTKAGGSALTLSLQDINAGAGAPGQPDETQDQTVAIANADAGFVSNNWYRTGTLSADRTVSHGDLLAVVLEFDGAGRLGADSVVVSAGQQTAAANTNLLNGIALKTGGSWAATAVTPDIILEMSDGSFGTFEIATPWSAVTSHSFNSGSAADEFALHFQVAAPVKIDGLWAVVNPGASSDFDLILYEGTSALATVSFDSNMSAASGTARILQVPIAEQTLAVGTDYYVAVKPTTANNLICYSFDVDNSAFLDLISGGSAFNYSTRVDGGSWASATATRRFLAGIRLSAIDDAAGGGGGHIMSRVRTGQ